MHFYAKQLNYPPKMCHWVPTNEKTSNYELGSIPSIPYPPLFEMWYVRNPKFTIYVGGMENAFLCKTTQLPP